MSREDTIRCLKCSEKEGLKNGESKILPKAKTASGDWVEVGFAKIMEEGPVQCRGIGFSETTQTSAVFVSVQ